MACDFNTILSDASCTVCLDDNTIRVLQIASLVEWAQSVTPGLDVTPEAILERAKCILCLDENTIRGISFQLLCNIRGT